MKRPDDEIERFFKDMRRNDQDGSIPEFEEMAGKPKHGKRKFLVPIGIAATLVVFWLYFNNQNTDDNMETGEIVVTLVQSESEGTDILLDQETTFDSWQSPTSYFVDDFNE
jgi:hypothetical protein